MAAAAGGLVAACEDGFEKRLVDAADAVEHSGALIVLVSGPSGSGKTTFARKLEKLLDARGHDAEYISFDDFYVGGDRYPVDENGENDYESLYALDVDLINKCFRELMERGASTLPRFIFRTRTPVRNGRRIILNQEPVVVAEGLHALNPEIIRGLDRSGIMRVHIRPCSVYSGDGLPELRPRDIRLARRMVRDVRDRGYDPEETLLMWEKVIEGERKWIAPFTGEADLKVNTSVEYEPGLLAPLVRDCLEKDRAGGGRCVLEELCSRFEGFPPICEEDVPKMSILREFIGGLTL